MATTPKAFQQDAIKGAYIEYGTLTVTPGSVSANTEGNFNPDTASPLCSVGDQIFINPRSLEAGLFMKGAVVSAPNTVQITLRNLTGSPVTGAIQTYDYKLIRYL